MKKDNRKPSYRIGYKHLLNHIKELEERLDQKDDLIETIIYYYIDSKGPEIDERTATRKVYKTIYGDSWKNYIDGKFLTKEESDDWFDDNHDAYLCSGDHIANMSYLDLAQWEVAEYSKQNQLNN